MERSLEERAERAVRSALDAEAYVLQMECGLLKAAEALGKAQAVRKRAVRRSVRLQMELGGRA